MFNILLKIYLGFGVAGFILMKLAVQNTIHTVRLKFKDKLKDKRSDKIGLIFSNIKLLILCFIPIYNIAMFIMAFTLFMNNEKLIEMSNIEDIINKSKNTNNQNWKLAKMLKITVK